MKKIIIAVMLISYLFTSCATLTGGEITTCQKHKPETNEPKRKLRPAPLVTGIVLTPLFVGAISLIVDFSTRAIYKPCGNEADSKSK